MDKRNLRVILIYAIILVILNGWVLASQVNLADWGVQQNLDFSKTFANALVNDMQEMANNLGVAERTNVKQALAKLHYDVYLIGNPAELASIVQNTASDTRDLIIAEYVKTSGEQVLRILNNAQEVQELNTKTVLSIQPVPGGGYIVNEPHNLSEKTKVELAKVPTLFSFDAFRNDFESYRSLSTLQVAVEGGVAQLAIPETNQDTILFWEKEIQTMRGEYAKVSKSAGFAEVSGAGLTLTLHDKLFSVTGGDLRRIVGELYSSGATAIAVNGHRLTVNSFIVDNEQGTVVDGYVIETDPVKLDVLGDYQTLVTGVDLLFSVVMKNMFYVDIEYNENLELPAKIIQ